VYLFHKVTKESFWESACMQGQRVEAIYGVILAHLNETAWFIVE
jgi:hypothetical protein